MAAQRRERPFGFGGQLEQPLARRVGHGDGPHRLVLGQRDHPRVAVPLLADVDRAPLEVEGVAGQAVEFAGAHAFERGDV
jgi:hypothetical protein